MGSNAETSKFPEKETTNGNACILMRGLVLLMYLSVCVCEKAHI